MNFQDCHEEQIQIPSHIQSYGYLIGLNAHDKTIEFYSENISEILDVDEDLLGNKFEENTAVFDKILNSSPYKNLDSNPKETTKNLDKVILKDKEYHITVYKFDGHIFIELEKYLKKQISRNTIYRGIKEIQSAKTEDEIWSALVRNVCEITGYDRVMIYKFMNDGSGKVVAEQKLEHMESYMNLYYPESDIPKQARALYLLNYKRIFSDIHSKPVPIRSNLKEKIDLTYSTVRAMSPIHAVYIKNSGASSSFSTSIILNNKLWGLVTCHSTEPKHIDLFNRIQAEICTMIAANTYSSLKSRTVMENEALFTLKSTQLKNRLYQHENLKESLFRNVNTILEISQADGFAVAVGDEIESAGEAPDLEVIHNIVNWARKNLTTSLYSDDAFALKYHEEIPGLNLLCSGIVISFLGKERSKLLIWFRKEFSEHIEWAGNPEKTTDVFDFYDQKKRVVSPRTSFMVFSEEIKGKSKYWSQKDILEFRKIHDTILETVQYQFERVSLLNRELNQVNEELDSFSHTISHDLATPLTVIKLNVQMLSKNKEDELEKAKIDYILNEIDNMSQMMANVLQLSRLKYSEYELQKVNPRGFIEKICEDSKLSYNCCPEITIGETPEIMGEPTLLYQVFQNLITNAVKYSSKTENPKVDIHGEIEGDWVLYKISDNGIGIPESERENVFKIFKRIDNAKSFSGSGVGLTIVHRIVKRLDGAVTFESKENEGTTFILKFRKPM